MTPKAAWPAISERDSLLDQLVALSRHYGSDPEMVLAGGGNTSVKDGDRLWVKASGIGLADITADGFVEMDRPALEAILRSRPTDDSDAREEQFKKAVMAARRRPEAGQRPSVESVLHHLLPCRFVVHTHATRVNMLTCCVGGAVLCYELLGDDALWVPYVDPGFILAQKLQERLEAYRTRTRRTCPPAVLMDNHGLIVCGDTPDEIRRNTEAVLGRVVKKLGSDPVSGAFGAATPLDPAEARARLRQIAPALRGLLGGPDALGIVVFDDGPVAAAIAGGADGRAAAEAGPLTPDQIVYAKSYPLWFEPCAGEPAVETVKRLRESVGAFAAKHGYPPVIVIARGLGVFAAGEDAVGAETARRIYLDIVKVMAGSRRLGGTHALTTCEREFIEHWEVEAYRKQVATGARRAGRAAGKVALVTGAARGFGFEIASDLADQGAHVVMADVNLDGVRAAAADICGQAGSGRALGIDVNVADSASVEGAIDGALRAYGGLDLLVSNAGVPRAGGVDDLSPEDFRFVTDVNYTGYFLCVKHAAPVMAVQRIARPDAWSDIIQINSKSGLAGSNRNSAYAGGKFGGIGLTQSFALELVEQGIKVNAICPGNFFDGPLWSDPKTGLFVQYLRAGKVPGAKTVEDVKRAYEAKVPLGRGCTTADVMKAIYYLVEQVCETGQALPVTGGQIMLH